SVFGRRPAVPRRGARGDRSRDRVGEQPHQPGGGRPSVDPRTPLPRGPQRHRRQRRRSGRQVGAHGLHAAMKLAAQIFKAYDVRGVYPGEVNDDPARAIGAAFVAYLGARQIAVGRDMRLSSPALAAAFLDGATSQGADVIDYGMIPTDMLYFAVARDR